MNDKLEHYLQLWRLSNPQPLAQTPTSHVYTVDYQGERAVLKILSPVGIADEKGGAVALRCYDGQGAVRLFAADEGAHLLEYVGGADLVPMVRAGDDEDAAHIIAQGLNQIHSAYNGEQPAGLQTLRRRFRALFRQAEQDKAAGKRSIYVCAAAVAEMLLDDPQEEVVLHGDIHHMNIRHHDERGWMVFDPKGLYGERTFDAANTLCNPHGMPELVENEDRILRISKILADGMGIDHPRLLAFVFCYACLSACWSVEDGDDGWRSSLNIAELTEPYVTDFGESSYDGDRISS